VVTNSTKQFIRMASIALGALAIACGTRIAVADAPPEAQAVLAQEHRWVSALANGDTKALAALLPDNFVHITYKGKLKYRADELADAATPKDYKEYLSEQTVDFTHNVAIVHGLNTISQMERVVMELRYTDVYSKDNGTWRPISAQETPVENPSP